MHAGVSATGVRRLDCYVMLTIQGHMGTRERWDGGNGGGGGGGDVREGGGVEGELQTDRETKRRV